MPFPLGVEQAFLVLGGVWFVNLVNFMDGLDWITVAEMVPVTALRRPARARPDLPAPVPRWSPLALCGALLGFAPFNKPVARLFLGDVGSLPIGLLVGWMLLQLAGTGALAAAILLPLYYLMDATITLLRRLARREKVWEAHRSHFYQKATDNGFSALEVSAHVFGLNLALAGLAAMTLALALGRGADRGACRGRRSRRPGSQALCPSPSGGCCDECTADCPDRRHGLHRPPSPRASCRSAATGSGCCCGARPRCPPERRAP